MPHKHVCHSRAFRSFAEKGIWNLPIWINNTSEILSATMAGEGDSSSAPDIPLIFAPRFSRSKFWNDDFIVMRIG